MAKIDGYEGLAALAHAIRRSTAMHIASVITEPEEGIEGMFINFERIAAKIGGHAEEAAQEGDDPEPLGVSWKDRETD